jgi:hypothetical protein
MRAAFLLAIFALGLAASGAVLVRSNGLVRAQSGWSLSERLQALRVNRALPAESQKQASLSVRGEKALFEIRDPAGPVLLQCPLHADLPALFASYASIGIASGCEAQAADEGGDVRLYELAGHVTPPLPGEAGTLTEQQLHDALFLPVLQVRPGAPVAAMKPGRLSACAPGQANCALSLSAGTLLYCGDLRTCAEGACFQGRTTDVQPDEVAASLAYAQTESTTHALVNEAVTSTTSARFIESPPWGLVGPGSAETAHDLRAFFEQHPRGLCFYLRGLDVERPREALLAAQALGFPIFAPFDPREPARATPLLRGLQRAAEDEEALAQLFPHCDLPDDQACKDKRERLGSQLRSALGKLQPPLAGIEREELPYHVGASGPFQLAAFDALRVRLESKAEVAKTKSARGKLTVSYQPLWPGSLADRRARCENAVCLFRSLWGNAGRADEGFESMVALFARRGGNTRCVRRLFNALAASDALARLQQEAREPLGEPGKCARPTALLPQGSCSTPAAPFGATEGECGPLRLGYLPDEPWAKATNDLAAVAAREHVAVEVAVGEGWDVLLTAASNYTQRDFPTLAKLAGQSVSARGKELLESYEAAIVFPPPAWADTPRTRATNLALLESDVAREGPLPIFVLAFVQPRSVALPEAQAEAARSRWYLPRLFAAWSSR